MDAQLFFEVAEVAERFVARGDVAERWGEPSALEGYTVGGLAAHLARAILTVDGYLAELAPDPVTTPQVDAAEYLVEALADHDPVDSEFHARVRSRGEDAAAEGPDAVVSTMRGARERLADRLVDVGDAQRITVLAGIAMTVEEYLETRLVELVVHLDDLAVSLGEEGPPYLPQPAYDTVAAVLAQVAARTVGGLATVRSLARRERHPGAVRAL